VIHNLPIFARYTSEFTRISFSPPRISRKMNLVAFGLILICCHVWAIEIDDNFLARGTSRRIGTYDLKGFLERLKSSLRNGDSELGIPKLDPFTADKIPVNINNPGQISLVGELTNVKVDGLSAYNVNAGEFKLIGLKANLDLSWPLVKGSTNYSVKGNALGFEIYGHGGINVAAHNFRFQTDVKLALKNGHIQITEMTIKMSLGALDFQITGLYGDDEISKIISKAISDMVPELMSDKDFVGKVIQIIMQIANKILGTMSLEDLLKLLG